MRKHDSDNDEDGASPYERAQKELDELKRAKQKQKEQDEERESEDEEEEQPQKKIAPKQEQVKVVEREVTLSLINDKLNYLISELANK